MGIQPCLLRNHISGLGNWVFCLGCVARYLGERFLKLIVFGTISSLNNLEIHGYLHEFELHHKFDLLHRNIDCLGILVDLDHSDIHEMLDCDLRVFGEAVKNHDILMTPTEIGVWAVDDGSYCRINGNTYECSK